MKRRSLLKAIAAGSMTAAAPMTTLLARSALAATGDRPIRTIFLFHPNGCVPDIFFPRPGSSTLPAMTAPLQRVFKHCLFLDGIGYPGRAHTHEGGAAKCLTGYSGTVHDRGSQGLSSIEVLMGKEDWANRTRTQILVPSIQMGVGTQWGDNLNKRISFDGTRDLHAVDDPRILYPQLFGTVNPGSGGGGDKSTQILSAIRADLSSMRARLGAVERQRLEQHGDALSVLEARLETTTPEEMNAMCAGPNIGTVGTGGPDATLWRTSVLEKISGLQQDMAIAALSCNLTRSIAFSYGVSVSPIIVPGTSTNDHDLSHQDAAAHTTSKIWWMGQIARFIEKLAATPDGPGYSLLDSTILCTVSDLAHGNRHNHFRIPMFLAGGSRTGLVGGRGIDLAPYGQARVQGDQDATQRSISHTDVLNTIAEKAGYRNVILPASSGRINTAWAGGSRP